MQPTQEEILNEPTGPRLDAWVAEWVMEYEVGDSLDMGCYARIVKENLLSEWFEFNPSQNIAHVWEVVEKMNNEGWFVVVDYHAEDIDIGAAICRAALLAKLDKE